jgi:hypothetical protein
VQAVAVSLDRARLTVGGLAPHAHYLLQVVPAGREDTLTPVGLHRPPADRPR